MFSLNKVQLVGHLGKDPEVVREDGKNPFAKIQIATNESWKQDGKRVTQTDWHSVVFYNGLVDIVEKYLKKGDKIYLEGKLKNYKWQDKNGNNRSRTEVIAQQLKFIETKNKSAEDAVDA